MSVNATGPGDVTDEQHARLQRALGEGYEVRSQLGRGGFATVYAAFDRQLKREVAIKVLRAELEAPVFRERFRREAEAVAQLRHPHIVPIYAVGEADGLAWLIMPHIRGESLQQRIEREGKLPIDDATRILRDAAGALAAAHRSGILHRDIKPDNIMLDGPEGHVLLMDFGIAKALGGGDTAVTATGMIVGTPQYMSPEQATGDKTIDARSDIYSLGVVGFQMIAGAPPFSAPNIPMLIMKHIAELPPPLRSLRRDCPAALESVIARCLEKEPDKRWTSADEMTRALRRDSGSHMAPGIQRIAERVSGSVADAGAPPSVVRARLTIAVAIALVVIAGAIDLIAGRLLFFPILVLIAGFVVASTYGRLWREGYEWRNLLSMAGTAVSTEPSTGAEHATTTPRSLEMRRLGLYAPAVHRARSTRGAIKGMLANMPRSEHERLPDLLSIADLVLAETTRIATQLTALDERVRTTSNSTRIPGDLAKHRAALEERFTQLGQMIERLHAGLDRVDSEGVTIASAELQAVSAEAAALLRPQQAPASQPT